jgi:hypothetical protein
MSYEDDRLLAQEHFLAGLNNLKLCAKILRGDSIDASKDAMRTEQVLSRAIDMLSMTKFLVPQRKP